MAVPATSIARVHERSRNEADLLSHRKAPPAIGPDYISGPFNHISGEAVSNSGTVVEETRSPGTRGKPDAIPS